MSPYSVTTKTDPRINWNRSYLDSSSFSNVFFNYYIDKHSVFLLFTALVTGATEQSKLDKTLLIMYVIVQNLAHQMQVLVS